MPREAGELAGKRDRLGKPRFARIEAEAFRLDVVDRARPPAPDRAGERRHHVFREAEHFADFADRRTCAISDDARCQSGAFAAIFLVDILNDLLAPLVLEIDIDIGRLVARVGDEAFEQEIVPIGVNLRYPQAEAENGIGCGPSSLYENAVLTCEADNVVDSKEISGKFFLLDKGKLLRNFFLDFFRHAAWITLRGPLSDEKFKSFLLARKPSADFVRIIMLKLIERELDPSQKADRLVERLRHILKEPRHFGSVLEMALGIGFEQKAGSVEGDALADAGDDIGERAALTRRKSPALCLLLRRRRGARTTPASEVRSAMRMPASFSEIAVARSSSGCEAPRKKEKFVATASSA